ncbi:MAG TPA: hypothetical protein VH333_05500 [Pseudonocardiaceae bacterium]|jgi:cytochrome P450|nr:hypothetical protein [Pseudonocardiaceae bacterium]
MGWLVTDPVVVRQVLNDAAHFTLLGEGGVGHLWAQVLGDYVYRIFDGPATPTCAPALVTCSPTPLRDAADLARVLVGRMMADLLGLDLPPDDDAYRSVFGTGERLARLALGSAASTELPPDVIRQAKVIIADLTRNVPTAFADAPADTLLGRCRELGLSLEETSGLAALLMVAVTETAATAMAHTVALPHDTGQQRHLIDHPERCRTRSATGYG